MKNSVEQMCSYGFEITKIVIEGRGSGLVYKLQKYVRFICQAISALNKKNYDLVYVHYVGHSLLPFLLSQNPIDKPLVVNAHGGDIFTTTLLGAVIQKLVIPIIRKAEVVVVPSEYFSSVVTKKFSIADSKIFISPSSGVNGHLFKPSDGSNHSGIFTIGFVSRIDEGKGWDTFLLAIHRLIKQGLRNFQVLMVGGGEQIDKFNAMIKKMGIKSYVQYVGLIPHHDLPNYYHKMDVFVFPTRLPESLGLVGLEALTCGVPVIGSNIGGLIGYIKPGYNGELFAPGDDVKLTEYLYKMISLNREELITYKLNAAESAKPFDSIVISNQMGTKLEQIIMGSKG